MDTQFLFPGLFDSGATPLNLLYKSIQNQESSIRIGLCFGMGSSSEFDNDTPNSITTQSHFSLQISFGKEWLQPINERWIFYYGGDLAPLINSVSTKIRNLDILTSENGRRNLGAELRPFLGVRFNINERLYLASEAAFFLKFVHGNSYNNTFAESSIYRGSTSRSFSSGFRPLNGIYLFYRF